MEVKTPSLPLQPWAREFARRWNSEAYSVFLISGNIFDIYAVQAGEGIDYLPLKSFLRRRLFPDRLVIAGRGREKSRDIKLR